MKIAARIIAIIMILALLVTGCTKKGGNEIVVVSVKMALVQEELLLNFGIEDKDENGNKVDYTTEKQPC